MIQLPFERPSLWLRALRVGGLGLSIAFHAALAWYAMQEAPKKEKKETWVEMAVVETPPPPPPPPPPPEPEKPKPKPVDFKDTVKEPPKTPPPESAPPPEPRKVRRVQGLSASSFAAGSGTGLDARAGTTLGTSAGKETLSIDEAARSVSYAATTTQPRLKVKPAEPATPEAVVAKGEKVEVYVILDLDETGRVTRVVLKPGSVSSGLGAEEACIEAWKRARYTPALQGDTPVGVTGIPQRCVFTPGN